MRRFCLFLGTFLLLWPAHAAVNDMAQGARGGTLLLAELYVLLVPPPLQVLPPKFLNVQPLPQDGAGRAALRARAAAAPDAKNDLATLLFADGPEKQKEALSLLRAAAPRSATAAFNLALHLMRTGALPADEPEIRKWAALAFKGGVASAATLLGVLETKSEQKIVFFEKAAAGGDLAGMVNLGRALAPLDPRTSAEHRERAWLLFTTAAEKNYAPALVLLGYVKAMTLVQVNHPQALKLFLQAGEAGSADALTNAAIMLSMGAGAAPDQFESTRLLRRAAQMGSGYAHGLLAEAYLGGRGIERDYAAALDWATRAPARSNPYARLVHARMVAFGLGLTPDPPKAFALFRALAEEGYAPAQQQVGLSYASGFGTLRDLAQARMWLTKAADNDFPQAMLILADMLDAGLGGPKDPDAATRYYTSAADWGLPAAQRRLGDRYYLGRGVAVDDQRAAHYLAAAMEQGQWGAAVQLGLMKRDGRAGPPDDVAACDLFRRGADKGSFRGMFFLSECFWKGKGVARDLTRAQDYLNQTLQATELVKRRLANVPLDALSLEDRGDLELADVVHTAAQKALEEIRTGLARDFVASRMGLPSAPADEVAKLRADAERGDPSAQNNLGVRYERGESLVRDPAEAARWYRKAADQNYALAQNNLGALYERGVGVPKDSSAAFELYKKAAEAGYPIAQRNLAALYANGSGPEQNDSVAFDWMKRAAVNGDAPAMDNLAIMYEAGRGVARDEGVALEWRRRAAEAQVPRAQMRYAQALIEGRLVSRDLPAAFTLLQRAADQNYVPAMPVLAALFERGIGVEPDLESAKRWYQLAAERGDANAKAALARLSATP